MTTAGVRVRGADAGDAPRLAALRWQWRTTEAGENATDVDAFTTAFADWMAANPGHRAWLAQDGDTTVGMAWLVTIERVPGPQVWVRRAGHLQSVYVLPAWRGRGVGASLVQAVLAGARAVGMDFVWVHPSERSFPLYQRAGFTETPRTLEIRLD